MSLRVARRSASNGRNSMSGCWRRSQILTGPRLPRGLSWASLPDRRLSLSRTHDLNARQKFKLGGDRRKSSIKVDQRFDQRLSVYSTDMPSIQSLTDALRNISSPPRARSAETTTLVAIPPDRLPSLLCRNPPFQIVGHRTLTLANRCGLSFVYRTVLRMSRWPRKSWINRVSNPSSASICPALWRSICGWT